MKVFDTAEDDEPDCDYRVPGDVWFLLLPPETLVNGNRVGWTVEPMNWDAGACPSYESTYGGFLDHAVQDLAEGWLGRLREADPDDDHRAGFYVLEGMVGTFYKGDGWFTHDDIGFRATLLRRMTPEEILALEAGADFWASCPDNVA